MRRAQPSTKSNMEQNFIVAQMASRIKPSEHPNETRRKTDDVTVPTIDDFRPFKPIGLNQMAVSNRGISAKRRTENQRPQRVAAIYRNDHGFGVNFGYDKCDRLVPKRIRIRQHDLYGRSGAPGQKTSRVR